MSRPAVEVLRYTHDKSPRRFTDIGSYPIFYLNERDEVLCPGCAATEVEDEGQLMAACDVNWEDPDLFCDECSERIESAYAEPETPS